MGDPNETEPPGLWTDLDALGVEIRLLLEAEIATGSSPIEQVIDDAGHFLVKASGRWFQFEIEEAKVDHYLKPAE